MEEKMEKTKIKTALYDEHVKLKGKLVNFNGFMLPVWFSSIKEEHMSVRKDVGVFDISHMGVLKINGTNAKAFLQKLVCNDFDKTENSKMIYAMILNEKGGVLDDAMVGQVDGQSILVVNAANKNKIVAWINKNIIDNVTIEDMTTTHGFLAVQGPNALEKLAKLFNLNLVDTGRFSAFYGNIMGENCLMMRTGYTGEDGFEIVISNENLAKVWNALIEAGITPCGLGARDTLRVEFGLPLYGQELSENINPYMTRYKWVVKLNSEFIGKSALEVIKDQPQKYASIGLKMKERIIPRTDYKIKEGGYITSGTLSPVLNKPIALALVNPEYTNIGTEITVLVRGKEVKAEVVKVPFIEINK